MKWIKITTDIFDDEKILLIESLPDAYAIITCWFKLLCLAGKQNNSGVFIMGKVAYTDKMLATIFRMKESTVTMALRTFEEFGMVEIVDGVITLPNWEKHQSLDKLEQTKEQTRQRVARHREKQKQIAKCNVSVTHDVTHDVTHNVTLQYENVTQTDIDKDKEREEDIEIEYIEPFQTASPSPKKPIRHKYGEYQNVLLSDADLEKLKAEFPTDYESRIERLSEYIASTGKSYKNHLATIRNWAKRDKEKKQTNTYQENSGNPFLEMLEEERAKGVI